MANYNNQPNKTSAGMNIAQSAQGAYGTEFASETNAQKVRQQNAQSAKSSQSAQGAYGTEFASETNAAEVRKQNQMSQARKSQNAGQYGQS
jgi:small acid-soluble spore protein E (minor gamma-type SASP)